MAVRFAVTSSNWSNPATWDSGTVPVVGDDVYANGFTVTIDQDVNVNSIRNTASPVRVPNIATPVMTANTLPSGIAFANTSATNVWQIFDQNTSTTWTGWAVSGNFGYQFTSAKIIKRYHLTFPGSGITVPNTWTFQGSNDGITYTTLDTVSGSTASSYTSAILANTTAYLYYRVNVTVMNGTGGVNVGEFQMTEDTGTVLGGTTGGTFNLNGGVTVTLTSTTPLVGQTTTLITYSAAAGNSSTINATGATITLPNTAGIVLINHSGAGTLTINGNMTDSNIGSAGNTGITVTGTGTLNYNGNFSNSFPYQGKTFINITGAATVNYSGTMTVNISSSNTIGTTFISCSNASATINVIGIINAIGNNTQATTQFTAISASAGTINMTGSINVGSLSFANFSIINLSGGANFTMTGTIVGGTNTNAIGHSGTGVISITAPVNTIGSTAAIFTTAASTLTIIGTCTASTSAPAVLCSSAAATNTFSGPFISNNNVMAIQVARLLLTSTPTYWRFQSNARTMYTSDYAPDFPSTFNVRSGVSYNNGAMIGTMAVPNTNSVAYGVPVDNTTGSAVLTYGALTSGSLSSSLWNASTSSLYVSNSIGSRLVNTLTQQAFAAQLAAFNPL